MIARFATCVEEQIAEDLGPPTKPVVEVDSCPRNVVNDVVRYDRLSTQRLKQGQTARGKRHGANGTWSALGQHLVSTWSALGQPPASLVAVPHATTHPRPIALPSKTP